MKKKSTLIIGTVAAGLLAAFSVLPTNVVYAAETQAQTVEWNEDNRVMLYSIDGRVVEVDESMSEDFCSVGWNKDRIPLTAQTESAAGRYGNGILYVLNVENVQSVESEYTTLVKRVYISRGTKTVGAGAFAGCTNLAAVEISDTVTQIGSYAFADCPIERIGIPSSVVNIADDAFGEKIGGNMVIYCEEGSAAEKFANKNGINCVLSSIIYSPDGRTLMVDDVEINPHLRGGWYKNADTGCEALYSVDGRCLYINEEFAQAYKANGWYTYKDLMVYGKSASICYGGADFGIKHCVSGEYMAMQYLTELLDETDNSDWKAEINAELERMEKAWFNRIDCPLGVGYTQTVNGALGIPETEIAVYNLSGKTVRSYKVQFVCFDSEGNTVSNSSYYSAVNVGYDIDCDMKSGTQRHLNFELKNNNRTAFVDGAVVTEVEFEDGTLWMKS